jgi:hypothetical protein
MTTSCDCCADRMGHMYRFDCQRCEARLIGRIPRNVATSIVAGQTDDMRAMIDEERERDAAQGFET